LVPSDIKPGRIYANSTGKIHRLVLAKVDIPDQVDGEGIKYEIIRAPTRIQRGKANSLGYVGLCTAKRFAVWAKEDMTGTWMTDPHLRAVIQEKLDQIERGAFDDDDEWDTLRDG